jgi:AraC-like DNA-binding protein
MMLDPLSSVLSLLNPRSALTTRLELGGEWSLAFPAYEGIKFNVLQQGQCWLQVDGTGEAMQLHTGDGYLLTDGRPYRLSSDPHLPARDARSIVSVADEGVVTYGGCDTVLLRGKFTFDQTHSPLLLDALEPVVRLPMAHASVIQWTLQELWQEVRNPGPGTALTVDHLSHLMLIHGLRAFLEQGGTPTANWLNALTDPHIGPVLSQMHANPAFGWTVDALATHASMSRSRFSEQFKRLVGMPPLTYLLRWRVRLAMRWLRRSQYSVARIAEELGYESDSAFSQAFRRETGLSPLRYRKAPALQLQT